MTTKNDQKISEAERRRAKLAAELRANLMKRKTQARAWRDGDDKSTAEQTDKQGDDES